MAQGQVRSILAVDCGSVMSKAVLLDHVGGAYRFVAAGEAPTTIAPPEYDMTTGIYRAVQQISDVTGRTFFDDQGDPISPQVTHGRGVDALAVTLSCAEPLRLVLSGVVAELSLSSARRAAVGTYADVRAVLGGSEGVGINDEERVRVIRSTKPDVVLVTGGIDGGTERPVLDAAKAATLACAMMDFEDRPTILYAGNAQLRRQITDIVGEEAELRVADNVRPALEDEQIWDAQQELQSLFRRRKMSAVPGVAAPAAWSAVPLTPTAHAFARLLEYVWHLGDPSKGILGIDLGGTSTTVAAVFDGQLYVTIEGVFGVASGGAHLVESDDLGAVTPWLPQPVTRHEAQALLINKSIHPASIPQAEADLRMEQAVACEAIRRTVDLARPGWKHATARDYGDLTPPCDTILLTGVALTRAPQPGQAALLVLNAVQPTGVTTLVLDRHGLAPALGSVAALEPLATVEALDAGVFTNLATVVAPIGRETRATGLVLRVRVRYQDGSELDLEVEHGDLEVVPLPLGEEAVLELEPSGAFDVGLGGPGRGGKRRVSGGLAGLIIDARGRPLRHADVDEGQHERMQEWLYRVGG